MPKDNEFVVQLNDQTELFLTVYNPNQDSCQWGNLEDAIIFSTLEEAQSLAASIGGGTVGTTKP